MVTKKKHGLSCTSCGNHPRFRTSTGGSLYCEYCLAKMFPETPLVELLEDQCTCERCRSRNLMPELHEAALTKDDMETLVANLTLDDLNAGRFQDALLDGQLRKMAWWAVAQVAQWCTDGEHRDCDFKLANMLTDAGLEPWPATTLPSTSPE